MNDELTDTLVFDKAVRQYSQQRLKEDTFSPERFGSILDQVKQQSIQRLESFRTVGQTIRPMQRIIFDYTDAPVLDAFACSYGKRYIIVLSASGAAVLHHTMFRLLSRSDVLEEIGDPTSELSHIPFVPLTIDFSEIIAQYLLFGVKMSTYMPVDSIREVTARVMAQFAIDFVIAHEFRHTQAGHIEYWNAISGRSLIRELNDQIAQPSLSLISQALEMDADSYGITAVLRQALRIADNPSEFTEGWGQALPNAQRAVFLSIMSAYIVFKLFDLADKSSRSWTSRSHPVPAMRNMMLISTVLECFRRWDRPELQEWLLSNTPRFIEVGERQFASVAKVTPNRDNLLRVAGSEGQAHVSEILRTWSHIEEELSNFSHVAF